MVHWKREKKKDLAISRNLKNKPDELVFEARGFFFLRMPPWNIPISEETKWPKQILKLLALNVQTIERFHCSTVNQLNLTCNIPTPRPSADTFREPAAATSGICSQQNFK